MSQRIKRTAETQSCAGHSISHKWVAYPQADVLMIAVGTPLQADGQADLQYVLQAARRSVQKQNQVRFLW
ncbi:hypothetical protein ACEQPO_27040 [Bacillus sp. SL00103]